MRKCMKYLIVFVLMLAVFCGTTRVEVSATENIRTGTMGENNGIQWSYDESTRTLTVTGADSGLAREDKSPFYDICSNVKTIVFDDCILSGSAQGLFKGLSSLENVAFEELNTKNVTDMSRWFDGCYGLKKLDISSLDTSSVTNMNRMFSNCKYLTELTLGDKFKTSKVTDMGQMFAVCELLKNVDLSGFNTKCVTNMSYMFLYCKTFRTLDLSSFDMTNVTDSTNILNNCSRIKELKTPQVIPEGFSLALGEYYLDSQGNQLYRITSEHANTILTRKELGIVEVKEMCVGEKKQLRLLVDGVLQDISENKNYIWSSFYTDVLTVSDTGEVEAVGEGYGYINVDENSWTTISDDILIVVKKLDKVVLKTEIKYLEVGQKDKLSAYVNGSSVAADTMKWSSSDEKVVTCVNGEIMAIGTGTALVSCTKENGTTATCKVIVEEGVSTQNTRIGTLGDNNKVQWSYDVSKKILTLTGSDSGLGVESNLSNGKLFSICADVEKIILKDFKPIGSAKRLFGDLKRLKGIEIHNFDTSQVTDMSYMFYDCSCLVDLDISGFDSSNVMDMHCMFYNCSSLNVLETSVLKTQSVSDMSFLFFGCKGLTSLNLKGWDTSNVKEMERMFDGCRGLTSLDLSRFNTTKVTSMYFMFNNCSGLTSLDLSNFETANMKNISGMFCGCSSLISLDISGFEIDYGYLYTYQFLKDCNALKIIYTPKDVGSNSIPLPAVFSDSNGVECENLVSNENSNILTRGDDKWNIQILADKNELVVGESLPMTLAINGVEQKSSYNKYFKWSTLAMDIVTISDDGLATTVVSGSTSVQVTVPGRNDLKAQLSIQVNDEVTLNKTEIEELRVGQTEKLAAYVNGERVTRSSMTWISSNPDVVTCVNGTLEGVSEGTATISCTKKNGTVATCQVTVVKLDEVTLNKTEINELQVGQTEKLTAYVNGERVTRSSMTWTSSNPDVVTCVKGTLEGVGEGTATISCTRKNGTVATCQVTVVYVFDITEHPADASVNEGSDVVFKVVATGKDLTYQWQFKNTSSDWINSTMEGANTDSITVKCTAARDGYQYRCIVKDAKGNEMTSEPAKLTVLKAINITTHPASQSAPEGTNVTFKVETKESNLTYQWQFKSAGSNYWADSTMAGATTNSITVKATTARNGYQYRCVVKDGNGNKATSNAAKLTVTKAISITTQPASQSVTEGTNVTFKVDAKGTNLTYQWQFKNATATYWTNSGMTGANTNSITVNATMSRNGYQYRCVIKDGNGIKVNTDAAKLTVTKAIEITGQPASANVNEGTEATFKVDAKGTNLTYQWQFKNATANYWSDSTMAGSKTNSIIVKGTAARNGYQYRCVVKDSNGNKVISNPAKLTVVQNVQITSQPMNQTVAAGANATFKVEAKGTNLTYQWQFKSTTNNYWSDSTMSGATTNSITVKGTAARNGYQYRCVVKDGNGNKVTSNAAMLTVK